MIWPFRRKSASVVAKTPDDIERLIFGYMNHTAAGISVTEKAAMKCSAVSACTGVLASSIAQMPLHLYKNTSKGRVKDIDHPLYDVLHSNPNLYQTSYEFREMMQSNLSMYKRAYALVIRVRGMVKELHPLHPTWVTPEKKNFEVVYKVVMDSQEKIYKRGEILVLQEKCTDGLMPEPRFKEGKESIALSLAAQLYSGYFYKNGAKSNGYYSTDGTLSDEAYERLKNDLKQISTGDTTFDNPLFENGLKWHAMSTNARDSQMIESRSFQVEEISRLFNVPPHLIMHLERATNNNIEHQGLGYVIHTISPLATLWEQAVNKDLLTKSERKTHFSSFNFGIFLRGDSKARSEFYSKMTQSAIMTRNEVRRLENLPEMEGADELTAQVNLVPLSELGKEEENDDAENTEDPFSTEEE